MKKHILLILIIGTLFMSACGNNQDTFTHDESQEPVPIQKIEEPCFNIFYPIALNNQWIYKFENATDELDSEVEPLEFSITVFETKESQASIGTLSHESGIVTQSTVICNNQEIVYFQENILNLIIGDVGGDIDIEYVSGLYTPNEETFENNNWDYHWETELIASGEIKGTIDEEEFRAILDQSSLKFDWEVIDTHQNIQTSSGTFDNTILVERKIELEVPSLKVVIDGESENISTTIKLITNIWYVPYIGMVNQKIISGTVQFFGIDFPIDANGNVELISSNLLD